LLMAVNSSKGAISCLNSFTLYGFGLRIIP